MKNTAPMTIQILGSRIPLGVAVCITHLVDCRPMTKGDEKAACCELYPRAVAWVLSDTKAITPFPVKGQLGIFEIKLDGETLDGVLK